MTISRYVRCAFSSLLKSKLLSPVIPNDAACGFMQGGPERNDSILGIRAVLDKCWFLILNIGSRYDHS